MSKRECPNCRFVFLNKKDFVEHVTYSSCAENLQGIMVLCPHCKKQFPDQDSLSFHILRNESCSSKQDKACDLLNRLPATKGNSNSYMLHKTMSDLSSRISDRCHTSADEVVHVEQGIMIKRNRAGTDNQRVSGGRRTKEKKFLSLEEIQCGGDDDTRPYFPIETMHHTHSSRVMSSLDPSSFYERNKNVILHHNVRPMLHHEQISNRASDLFSSNKHILEKGPCPQDPTAYLSGDSAYNGKEFLTESFTNEVLENDFHHHDDQSATSLSSSLHISHIEGIASNGQSNEQHDDNEDGISDDITWDGPNTSILKDSISVQKHHSKLLFSEEIIAMTDLYAMLDRRGIPAHIYDTLAQWAWKNRNLMYRMSEPPMKRAKYLKQIRKSVRGTEEAVQEFRPKRTLIELSSGRLVYVTTIGFENMVKDLLSNTMLMSPENLLWETSNDASILSEVHTGQWWTAASRAECTSESDLLWPLILFIDAMKISNMGSLRLEPVTFTFSRFKRHIRYQDNAWRTAAFLEDVNQKIVGRKMSSTEKLQDYHDILRFIFSDLSNLQKTGIAWSFSDNYGQFSTGKVILRVPIQLIIGDCEGHDKLCGRYKCHTQNVKGLCRDCDVPTVQGANVDWKCCFRTSSDMLAKTPDELAAVSFHSIDNALNSISFGGTYRGYFGALLAENLHVLKGGLFPLLFDGIWSSLSQNAHDYLQIAAQYFVHLHKNMNKEFVGIPPIDAFRNGLTSEGVAMDLDSSEKHGRVFLLYCLLTCSPVVMYISTHQKRGTEYNFAYWKQITQMLEMTLSLEAWVTSKEHRREDIVGEDGLPESSKAHTRIRQCLHKIKVHCPTLTNSQFRIPKFHQCLHFPRYIFEHGSMLNFDGNRPESMAKKNLKDPATHTQCRQNKLTYQTANKYLDHLTVIDAQRIISEESYTPVEWSEPFSYITLEDDRKRSRQQSGVQLTGTRFDLKYYYDNDLDTHRVALTWKTKGDCPVIGYDNNVIQYVSDRLFNSRDGGRVDDNCVMGCTSMVMSDGTMVNAHPYFLNERPRHDWVLLRWSEYEEPVPARVEMFLDLRESNLKFDNNHVIHPDTIDEGTNDIPVHHVNKVLEKSVYAVVWSAMSSKCAEQHLNKYHLKTSLCYRVKMEPFKRLVEVSSIESKCFAYMNTVGDAEHYDNTAIVFHDVEEWSQIFLDGCIRS